jgi:hypothetical protein
VKRREWADSVRVLSLLVTAGVLVPIWALWLAARVPILRQPEP